MNAILSSKFSLLFALIAVRIVNTFLVRTYFVPDEIFQSVEVAYRAVYGIGYLSWEWTVALRSALHPAVITVLYLLGRALSIDSGIFIIQAPRLLHSVLFAFSDYCYYKLARRILSPSGAKYAFLSYLLCWFVWYCAPRTLSNTLETTLTLFALCWYPISKADLEGIFWPYMSVGLVTILIRPTAVLIWIPFGLWHLWRSESPFNVLFRICLPSCFPVLLCVVFLDSVAYGKLTFTTWNFISFNVFQGGSEHFGAHPWHWFLSQGLIAVLTVQLIPIFSGMFIALRKRTIPFVFFWTPVLYVTVHSLIAHKEHRFLLPIIPLLCLFAGVFFDVGLSHRTKRYRIFWIGLLLVNVPLVLYTGLFHQVGTFSATNWIRNDAKLRFLREQHVEIIHLMPCFSLPQYSYFHDLKNVTITALDCSPNLNHVKNYIDEADQFHVNPVVWILKNMALIAGADYVVFYEKTYRLIEDLMASLNFKICARLFHAHFLSSNRQDHYILVACR